LSAIASARGPESRTMPTPPAPAAVATAAMVSVPDLATGAETVMAGSLAYPQKKGSSGNRRSVPWALLREGAKRKPALRRVSRFVLAPDYFAAIALVLDLGLSLSLS